MDDARKAVQLFLAKEEQTALHYGSMLHSDNSERKETDKLITEEALRSIADHPEWADRKSTVVFNPGWHKGVVGIVASRLIEQYYRPTIVLTRSGNIATGSARSVPGFNLYEALHNCKEYLLGYGGHYAAAGLSLDADKVDSFRDKFESIVSERISPELLIPELVIDAVVELEDLTEKFFSITRQMEPIGPDNPKPLFLVRKVTDTGHSRIVKEQHIKFSLRKGDRSFQGIGFGMADKFELLSNAKPIDIVFTLEENEWNGNKSLQLRVTDIRSHAILPSQEN